MSLNPIDTGNSEDAPLDITNQQIFLYDIIVSKESPHKFQPNNTNQFYAGALGANAYTDSEVLAYVYTLDIQFNETAALKNLAGFDIFVYQQDPNINYNPPQQPSYKIRTVVSSAELGYPNNEYSVSPAGQVKYFSGESAMTVISTAPLSPQSKLLTSKGQQSLAALQAKQEAVETAASNTTPGLLRCMNNTTSQNSTELNNFFFKNGGSLSALANASIAISPLEDSIKKSSLGMDWFAPKDNTNVYLSKGRIADKSSLLEERIAALRVYDNQVGTWVDIVGNSSVPGTEGPPNIVDNTKLYQNVVPSSSRVYRRIEIPKKAVDGASQFYLVLQPLQKSGASSSMLWDSFSSSWVSSDAPVPFTGANLISLTVPHGVYVSNLLTPILPVNITAVQLATSTRVTVTALDPGNNAVTVRRIKLKRTPHIFEYVSEVSLQTLNLSLSGKKTAVIVDNAPLAYPYYSCYIANNGASGIESQVVIEGRKNQYTTSLTTDNVSIVASNGAAKDDGVSITVSNIPSPVKQIKIMRENLDCPGASREKTIALSSDTGQDIFGVSSTSFVWTDKTAHLGKKYRYFPVLRGILGSEEICTSEAFLIRSYSLRKIPFTLTLAEPEISFPSQYMANISIVANMTTNELAFSNLIKIMQDAGMSSVFQAAVNTQKSQFPALGVYKVSRVNVTTGIKTEIEWGTAGDMPNPTTPGGNTVNNQNPGFTINDSIELVEFNQRFYYEFELSLRPPEAFLAGVLSSYTSYNSTANIATRRAVTAGFLPEWGYLGALPSDEDIQKIADGDMPVATQFKKGLTGHVISSDKITIPVQYLSPSITNSYVNTAGNIVIDFSPTNESASAPQNVMIYKSFLMYKGPGVGSNPVVLQTLGIAGSITVSKYSSYVGVKEYYIVYLYPDAETGMHEALTSNSTIFEKNTSQSLTIKIQ